MALVGKGHSRVRSRRRTVLGRFALLVALVGAVALPLEAAAQSNGAASAKSEEAVALFEEGTRAASAGQWEKARLAFAAAWERRQHWQIAAHLGRAELQTGRHREAAEHLSYFLREAKGVNEADRKQSREMLEKALAKVSAVTVRVNVDGAEVLVDGRSVGRSPLAGPVYVDPGRRTFEAKLEGYGKAEAAEEMKGGAEPTVELSLGKLPSLSKPLSEEKPIAGADARVGARQSRTTLIAGGTALSGAFAAAGVAFTVLCLDNKEQVESHQGKDEAKFNKAQDRQNLFAGLLLVSFAAAGTIGGWTLYEALWARSNDPSPREVSSVRVEVNVASANVTVSW